MGGFAVLHFNFPKFRGEKHYYKKQGHSFSSVWPVFLCGDKYWCSPQPCLRSELFEFIYFGVLETSLNSPALVAGLQV